MFQLKTIVSQPKIQSILVVDDDPVTRALLRETLNKQGYQIIEAENAKGAYNVLNKQLCDLILLDRRLPDCDGLMLLRKLRGNTQIPVIILSILGDEHDRVLGLELGAADYLAKPFNTDELSIRIRNALRHQTLSHQHQITGRYQFGSFIFELSTRTLKNDLQQWNLTVAEAKLLSLLLQHRGYTQHREQLTRGLFNRDWTPSDRTVDVLIGRLRKIIEDNPKIPAWIVTMHGEGYLFKADASKSLTQP